MAFPTTPEETLKYFLAPKVIGEEDSTRFMSFEEALVACEEEEAMWQAVYALSVHLHAIGRFRQTAEFSNYLTQQKFTEIHHGLYSEALSRSTDRYLGKEPWMHWLWELLITQLAYSECKSTDVMEMLASVLSDDVNAQGRPFVAYGKLMAGNTLTPLYMGEANYKAAVEAMTKVAECLPTEDVFTQLDQLVDHWVFQCENIPVQEYSIEQDKMIGDCPEVEGKLVDLLDSVASAVGTCHNSLGDEEVSQLLIATDLGLGKAGKTSSEYWAWKFGHVLGRLSHRDRIVHQNLLALCCWGDIGNIAPAIASLLLSREVSTDWQQAHEYMRGMAMFRSIAEHGTNVDLSDVSPTSRLYWAMRIGFVDAMREKAIAIVPQAPITVKDTLIGTALTYSDLRQLKDHEAHNSKLDTVLEVLKLLPDQAAEQYKAMFAWPQDMEPFLQESLTAEIIAALPPPIVELMKDAEAYYRSKIRPWSPNMSLSTALEETLNYFFIERLETHYGKTWVQQKFYGYKTQLSKWGTYFLRLCSDRRCDKSTQPDITPFLGKWFPSLDYDMLNVLGQSLKEAAERKNILGHSGNKDKNRAFIELRDLAIVSKHRPPIIKQMVELFGGKRDSA